MFAVLLSALMAFSPQNLVQKAIPSSAFESVEASREIVLVKFDPSTGQCTESTLKKFEKNEMIILKSYLLDDSSYYFDKTKTCPFIPQYALKFSDSDDVIVLISPSGKQLKFKVGDQSKILDYDPMANYLNQFL